MLNEDVGIFQIKICLDFSVYVLRIMCMFIPRFEVSATFHNRLPGYAASIMIYMKNFTTTRNARDIRMI